MSKRTNIGIFFALMTSIMALAPVCAQYYVNPYNASPYNAYPYNAYPYNAYPNYNNYGYRGYAPHGYGHYHTMRNVAVGAGIGAAAGALVGLLASPHGHRYY